MITTDLMPARDAQERANPRQRGRIVLLEFISNLATATGITGWRTLYAERHDHDGRYFVCVYADRGVAYGVIDHAGEFLWAEDAGALL